MLYSLEMEFVNQVLNIVNSFPIHTENDQAILAGKLVRCRNLAIDLYDYNIPLLNIQKVIEDKTTAKSIAHSAVHFVQTLITNQSKSINPIPITDAAVYMKYNKMFHKNTFSIYRRINPDLFFTLDMVFLIAANIPTEPDKFKICPKCGDMFYQYLRTTQKYCSNKCSNMGRSGKNYND